MSWNVLLQQKKTLVPTNAFELLTRNNSHFAVVQCACFKGKTKGVFIDKADYEGPVQERIEQAYQFILRNIRMGAHVEGLYRVERYELPEGAPGDGLAQNQADVPGSCRCCARIPR